MAADVITTLTLRGDDVPMAAVWKRLATAVVGIPAFVALVLEGPALLFGVLVVALGAGAAWELARMFHRAGRAVHPMLATVATAIVIASFLVPGGAAVALALALVVALSASLWVPTTHSAEFSATTVLTLTYVGWLLGHAVLVRDLPSGAQLVIFLTGVTWAGESSAYAVGSTLGRHKLAPAISPGKTIEGAIGQVVASVIAAALLAAWLLPEWALPRACGAGVLLGVAGQFGDLAESTMKRSLGTKDTGGLLPGHGGILDRLDGLLFNAPVLFYYVRAVGVGA